ncbi:MAG TPA: hypothetical protein VKY57_10730 [Chitinispirillaceae bacterium]|nr:hypothetical protein [Chitinispirillaceae bacterium]
METAQQATLLKGFNLKWRRLINDKPASTAPGEERVFRAVKVIISAWVIWPPMIHVNPLCQCP